MNLWIIVITWSAFRSISHIKLTIAPPVRHNRHQNCCDLVSREKHKIHCCGLLTKCKQLYSQRQKPVQSLAGAVLQSTVHDHVVGSSWPIPFRTFQNTPSRAQFCAGVQNDTQKATMLLELLRPEYFSEIVLSVIWRRSIDYLHYSVLELWTDSFILKSDVSSVAEPFYRFGQSYGPQVVLKNFCRTFWTLDYIKQCTARPTDIRDTRFQSGKRSFCSWFGRGGL